MFKRITKREAKALFAKGEVVYFCPCKFAPDGPWSMACGCHPTEWLEQAKTYEGHPILWKGTVEATAWDLAYNNWAYYNATNETGLYAHYYLQLAVPSGSRFTAG